MTLSAPDKLEILCWERAERAKRRGWKTIYRFWKRRYEVARDMRVSAAKRENRPYTTLESFIGRHFIEEPKEVQEWVKKLIGMRKEEADKLLRTTIDPTLYHAYNEYIKVEEGVLKWIEDP